MLQKIQLDMSALLPGTKIQTKITCLLCRGNLQECWWTIWIFNVLFCKFVFHQIGQPMKQSWCKKSNKKGDRFGSSASHRAAFKPSPADSSEPYKFCNSAYVWGWWGLSHNCECLISKWMQMEGGRCWGSKEIF